MSDAEKFIIGHLHPGHITGAFYDAVLAEITDPDCLGVISRENGVDLCRGRNLLAQQFLATSATWLLMLDSDMTWDRPLFYQLRPLASPTTIATAPYFSYNRATREVKPCTFDANLKPMLGKTWDPFEVHACGTGCMLLHRDILARIPFTQSVTGTFLEDVGFCLNARNNGIKIMCNPRIRLGHTKQMTIWPADYLAFLATL